MEEKHRESGKGGSLVEIKGGGEQRDGEEDGLRTRIQVFHIFFGGLEPLDRTKRIGGMNFLGGKSPSLACLNRGVGRKPGIRSRTKFPLACFKFVGSTTKLTFPI